MHPICKQNHKSEHKGTLNESILCRYYKYSLATFPLHEIIYSQKASFGVKALSKYRLQYTLFLNHYVSLMSHPFGIPGAMRMLAIIQRCNILGVGT